jgi:transposase InsO family protein
MVKRRGPPSQRWRSFLHNHAADIAAMDLFVVPTIGFDLLYVLVIVRLARRDLVWINVTANPTAQWITRQITEAFPWDDAPRYLIRDRDRIYGAAVLRRLRAMGIRDKPIAPRSPWQNGIAERLIGSIRRECTDHVVALGEGHLRRVLQSYARSYNESRTHRSLNKDAPVHRPIESLGAIISRPVLGGLRPPPISIWLDRGRRALTPRSKARAGFGTVEDRICRAILEHGLGRTPSDPPFPQNGPA